MIRLLLHALRWLATPRCHHDHDHSYDPAEDAALDALTAWVHDLGVDPVDQHYTTTVIALHDGLLRDGMDLVRGMANTDHLASALLDEDPALRSALLPDYPHLGDAR